MAQSQTSRPAEPAWISPARPSVLILRSSRPAEFAAAVRDIRRRHPAAHITALSQPGHERQLRGAGVDALSEVSGKRLSLTRLSVIAVVRLRRRRFDEIVIPQMVDDVAAYGNLYRLCAAIGAERIVLAPRGGRPRTYTRQEFRRLALNTLTRGIRRAIQSPPCFLMLMVAACCWPRVRRRRSDRCRVLHIISSLTIGGAQRQLAEVVNATPRDRYDLEILVLTRTPNEFSRGMIADPSLRVTYHTHWPALCAATLAVRSHCLRGRYDVVHTWLLAGNTIGATGARLAGVPRIITSVRSMSFRIQPWSREWWYRSAELLSARVADVITVNAHALVKDHAEWACYPSNRIQVVHNGVDVRALSAGRSLARRRLRGILNAADGSVVIGTVGRLATEKDQSTFLAIVQALRRDMPWVRAVLIGDGPLRTDLERLAAELGLDETVTFLGQRTDARELMAGLDVLVLSSLLEGFPNVLLEAVLLGVPAVASDVGGCSEVVPHPEHLFAAGDAASACERVRHVLADPAATTGRTTSMQARALAMFSIEESANRWCELYGGAPQRLRDVPARAA